MRQFRQEEILVDNCRPSGLFGSIGDHKDLLRKKKIFTIKTTTDITPEGVLKRWVVYSSGKRSTTIRMLFLKFLYQELSKEEYKILLSFPEITNSIPMFFAFRARIIGIPKRYIRRILEVVQIQDFKVISYEEYLGLRTITFTFKVERNPPIERPEPYSGYRRGHNDGKNTTKFHRDEFNSTPLEPSPIFEDEINNLLNFAIEISQHPRIFGRKHNSKEEENELE